MLVRSPRDSLATALAAAGRAASSRTTIPVLSHLLLRSDDAGVSVSATDMELSLRVPVPEATGEEGGGVALPRVAADIVRSLPPGEVVLRHNVGEAVATLEAGASRFSLNSLPASDFPDLPPDEGTGLVMPGALIGGSIERVARAASRDETRPVLTGVLVRVGAEGLTLVATDSYRLAVESVTLESPPAEQVEAIIPARALSELARLAGGKGETAEMVLSESTALFRIGDMRLTSRLIDGQFPDYRQLVPTEFTHDVTFDRAELLSVLSRISVLAQRSAPVRLAFTEGEVTFSTSSEALGEGREALPIPFHGEDMEVGFNVEFLRNGVESIGEDSIRMGLISPLRPGLLRGEGDDYRYLLMPIRLNA